MNEILDLAMLNSIQSNDNRNKKSLKSVILQISSFEKESNSNLEILKLLDLIQKQFIFSKNEVKSELYKSYNNKTKTLVYSFSFYYLNKSPLFRNHCTISLELMKRKFKSWIKKHSLQDYIVFILNAKYYQNDTEYGFNIVFQSE